MKIRNTRIQILSLIGIMSFFSPVFLRGEDNRLKLIDIEPYKDTYFLMGHPDTKIQISFKFKAVKDLPLYVGYSQLMMWELFQSGPFFSDLNYNPDVFYRLQLGDDHSAKQWIDFGFFEHESNGVGGPMERSWDRTYVRYEDRINLGEDLKLYWGAKAWIQYRLNDSNPDIAEYRGRYELNLTLANLFGENFDISDLTLRVFAGGWLGINPLSGGQELTLQFKSKYRKILPLLVFQVFHGYGENLHDYNVNHFGLRAGIGI